MVDKNEIKSPTPFLQRLRKDSAGNTLAMAAAALFPIMGLVGGGVDMGRAYMAKARLQQACDAAVLAGRRNMTQDTLTVADKAEAQKFFDFNFPEESFGSTKFDATVTDKDGTLVSQNKLVFKDGSDVRVVEGEAQTTIRTTLMRVFGYENMVIKTDCSSRLDVGNVDVMMVLDVTGSMLRSADASNSSSATAPVADQRLTALQLAVQDFYGILGGGGGSSGEQIRYGFVPYTSTVNVGKILYDANPSWLVGGTANDADNRWSYQTQQGQWEVIGDTPISSTTVNPDDELLTFLDGPECTNQFSQNQSVPGWWNANPSGNPVVSTSRAGNIFTRVTTTYSYLSWDGSNAPPPANAVGSAFWRNCERSVEIVTEEFPVEIVDVWEPGATFLGWTRGKFSHDVSAYVQSIVPGNDPAQRPTVNGLQLDRWRGCIEERDSTQLSATATSIPAGSLDMDINLLPTDSASRWRPHWPEVVIDPTSGNITNMNNGFAPCPTEARKLASYASFDAIGTQADGNPTTSSMADYIASLQANGGTNHAIGMIWGARLLSENGLFAAENSTTPNGFNIGRHLIFMTDGEIDIRGNNYGSFNRNDYWGKIAPTSEGELDLEARQTNRFKLMCQEAKKEGWTIWVVQFGVTTVSADMLACASGPENAAPATSRDTLRAAFSNIAQKIGGLRLSN